MLSGRKVTVLGAGLSGRAAAVLARDQGATVVLSDLDREKEGVEGVESCMGSHPDRILLDADLLVVSPGIPAAAPPVQKAADAGVEVVSELGFAAGLLPVDLPLVAVTGTNGKSTVTCFVGQLLQAAGRKAFVGGNLGTPLSEAVGGDWDVAVVEVSSYQMEFPGAFSPQVACVLNLSPDHLERHGDLENYAAHKCRLLHALRHDGVAVIPAAHTLLESLAEGHPGRRAWLGRLPGVVVKKEEAWLDAGRVDLRLLKSPGGLNRRNAAAACLLAHLAGVDVDDLDIEVLTSLPHRMEAVAQVGGVLWINDSKATNVDATREGLVGLDMPLVVLLGGQGKPGSDYQSLGDVLRGRSCTVICFGGSGEEIAGALAEFNPHLVPSLGQAVAKAREIAIDGDAVVLSPACASFDEFEDFEHRGRVFTQLATGHEPGTESRRVR